MLAAAGRHGGDRSGGLGCQVLLPGLCRLPVFETVVEDRVCIGIQPAVLPPIVPAQLRVGAWGLLPKVFRVQGAGCRVQGAGCRVQRAACRVQGVCLSTLPTAVFKTSGS